jgi:hypothetical protein
LVTLMDTLPQMLPFFVFDIKKLRVSFVRQWFVLKSSIC